MKKEKIDVQAEIELMILKVCKYVGQELTTYQITACAELICDKAYHLNLADIQLAFDKVREGQIKTYTLNPTLFMQAIRDYQNEKLVLAEEMSCGKHQKVKHEKGDWSPKIKAMLDKWTKELTMGDYNERLKQTVPLTGEAQAMRERFNEYCRLMDAEIGFSASIEDRARWQRENKLTEFLKTQSRYDGRKFYEKTL